MRDNVAHEPPLFWMMAQRVQADATEMRTHLSPTATIAQPALTKDIIEQSLNCKFKIAAYKGHTLDTAACDTSMKFSPGLAHTEETEDCTCFKARRDAAKPPLDATQRM